MARGRSGSAACGRGTGRALGEAVALGWALGGRRTWSVSLCSHLLMHCRWKACPHVPQTTGESSPGNLLPGGQPSNGMRQIPHTSSPAFHVHDAAACQCLTVTFSGMMIARRRPPPPLARASLARGAHMCAGPRGASGRSSRRGGALVMYPVVLGFSRPSCDAYRD